MGDASTRPRRERNADGEEIVVDGPTELVEAEDGTLVERLSSGTATLLLVWLMGIGALSTLVGAWLFVFFVSGERLGLGDLFGGFGFYTALGGAAGPSVLWLAGRAQGHSLAWFGWTAMRIAGLMVVILAAVVLLATLVLAGRLPEAGVIPPAVLLAVMAAVLSQVWGLATWGADRWIARARVE